jgi:nitrile hydratase beta subunit
MDGVHDMGGMDGFGAVTPELDEPVFHAKWEGRVIAMNRVMGWSGAWNIDMARYGIELLPPQVYLAASYYEKWFLRLQNMLLERGLIDADEIAACRSLRPAKPSQRGTFTAAHVEHTLRRGAFGRPEQAPALFRPGDRVRARNLHPRTHTRLPRYVRGHIGVVERLHGAQVYPDTASLGDGENSQWLYTVCFNARELWGDDADPTVTVSVDAFEPYLDRA